MEDKSLPLTSKSHTVSPKKARTKGFFNRASFSASGTKKKEFSTMLPLPASWETYLLTQTGKVFPGFHIVFHKNTLRLRGISVNWIESFSIGMGKLASKQNHEPPWVEKKRPEQRLPDGR